MSHDIFYTDDYHVKWQCASLDNFPSYNYIYPLANIEDLLRFIPFVGFSFFSFGVELVGLVSSYSGELLFMSQ